ncbi:MAG: TolC family protein, partial [Sulfurimonadaceae bacterium]
MKNAKTLSFLHFLLFVLPLSAQEAELLSSQKQELLLQEQNRYESENEKLRNNWIAPLNLGASWGYDKSYLGDYGFSKDTSASITQDIFRSGGIEYQIEYADAKKRADAMALNSQRAALNEEIFTSVLNYKKTLYQKEQSELTLKNQEIEVFIKQQLYDAGKADITELNN